MRVDARLGGRLAADLDARQRLAVVEDPSQHRHRLIGELRHDVVDAATDVLGDREPVRLGEALVDVAEPELAVDEGEADGRLLQQRVEQRGEPAGLVAHPGPLQRGATQGDRRFDDVGLEHLGRCRPGQADRCTNAPVGDDDGIRGQRLQSQPLGVRGTRREPSDDRRRVAGVHRGAAEHRRAERRGVVQRCRDPPFGDVAVHVRGLEQLELGCLR